MDTKILELFKSHNGQFLSGEDISERLKVTRAAVWKHIEKLRDVGYDIEAVPHLGYRLRGIPDKMLPDEIQYKLETEIIGKTIYAYEKTDSTNRLAYDLAEKGSGEGIVVVSEQQRRGKGRLGRKWVSPPGGIYLSCIIRPTIAPSEIQEFTLVAALSVCDALNEVTGLMPRIKWPNDILLGGKKVCGILTEMKAETDRIDFIVLGIGINVNASVKALPGTATSLSVELDRRVSRIDIVRSLLRNLEKEYFIFKERGFCAVRESVKKMSDTLHKRVRVSIHNDVIEGEAVDIDEEGALVLRMDAGSFHRVVSGDVSLLR